MGTPGDPGPPIIILLYYYINRAPLGALFKFLRFGNPVFERFQRACSPKIAILAHFGATGRSDWRRVSLI